MKLKNRILGGMVGLGLLGCGVVVTAENGAVEAQPPKASVEAAENWHRAAFGVFIHWTPSVVFQGRYKGMEFEKDLWGEWFMKRTGIPQAEYEAALKQWNPDQFNAEEWGDLLAEAGFKYMVFVAKHHDGFAMFDSAASDYNIVDHSGFAHDPYGELCAAVAQRGIAPGFYYSHGTDWRNLEGGKAREKTPQADAYFEKIVYPQLKELCSYTQPFVVWFDLGAPKVYAEKCLEVVRAANPNAMVSSRIGAGLGDFETGGDQLVPPATKPGFWETCMTMNWHWAWSPGDRQHATPEEIIRMLATIRSRGGNLLLNIGPDVRGRIPLRDQEILLHVGDWLKKNGAAIYGAEATPYHDLPWGVCTTKEQTLFLHVFQWPSRDTLFLPGLSNRVESVAFLADSKKQPLSFQQVEGGYSIDLSSVRLDPAFLSSADTVLAVKYEGTLAVREVPCLDQDLDNSFIPALAHCSNGARNRLVRRKSTAVYSSSRTVFNDAFACGFDSPNATLEWSFDNTISNFFYLELDYANLTKEGIRAQIQVDGETLVVDLPPTICASPEEQSYLFRKTVSKAFPIEPGQNLSLTFRLEEPVEKMEKEGKKKNQYATFMLRTIRLRSAYPPLY